MLNHRITRILVGRKLTGHLVPALLLQTGTPSTRPKLHPIGLGRAPSFLRSDSQKVVEICNLGRSCMLRVLHAKTLKTLISRPFKTLLSCPFLIFYVYLLFWCLWIPRNLVHDDQFWLQSLHKHLEKFYSILFLGVRSFLVNHKEQSP